MPAYRLEEEVRGPRIGGLFCSEEFAAHPGSEGAFYDSFRIDPSTIWHRAHTFLRPGGRIHKKIQVTEKGKKEMRLRLPLLLVCLPLLLAAPVLADWNTGDPYKWLQNPDLSTTGIDINLSITDAGDLYILADDFKCTETGPITGVHIWTSWLFDYLPGGLDPDNVTFTLSFHADIPDSLNPDGYSMPGDVLWYKTFHPGEFTARVWQTGIREGWMDPPDNYLFQADSTCWQYNFFIDAANAFYQEGTPDNPVVYWLDVQAFPGDPSAQIGWKTTLEHWNDDAVWGQGQEPYFGPWHELIYPPNHEMFGQSIDLAFVIAGEDQPQELDFGDAPDGPIGPGYRTLLGNNGARHFIGGPWLGDAGDTPDSEIDGQPHPTAHGDDLNDGNDDEDGVTIPILAQGGTSTITVEVNGGGGVLEAWIDFDGDWVWTAAEQVYSGLLAAGNHSFNVTTPAAAVLGQTFARFRISTGGGLPPFGPASDGEVEDYVVQIEEQQSYKWIQPPDLDVTGIDINATYPYILADDFLCTRPGPITTIWVWGSWQNDWLPFGDSPRAVDFILSFHKDIPDSLSPTGYSMPGDPEWVHNFVPAEITVQVWASGIREGWMDPPDLYFFPGDSICWLYKFDIDPALAFYQEGTEADPVVYWLDVQAVPHDPDAIFGWKTSWQHWNDDAVWGQGPEPYFGPWFELTYQPQHVWYPQSIDMAFLIEADIDTDLPGEDGVPQRMGLHQNVPNPFNPMTEIRYEIPAEGSDVTLEIFDVAGRRVRMLVDGFRSPGEHAVTWNGISDNGRHAAAGIYFYRLQGAGFEETRKMILVK